MAVFAIIIIGLAILVIYKAATFEPKKRFEHQDLVEKIQSRIAKANGASIEQFSLENLSGDKTNTAMYSDIYKETEFINKNCTRLEDFIINDEINSFDLMKLADLNGIQLQISNAWYPMVIELIKELDYKGWNREVSCVKEKYASLRFYSMTKHDDIIEKYERKSEHVCETCGERGEIRYNTGWDYVACRKHYLENRGKIIVGDRGFGDDKTFYQWKDIKHMNLEDLNHNDEYRFMVVTFFKNNIEHPGWRDNKLYVSKNTIGFGNFLALLPDKFEKNDSEKQYLEKFKKVDFCEICGYKAVYSGDCECCENDSWEKYSKRWKYNDEEERKYDHIKYNQIRWAIDEGDLYESQHENYLKNPDHKILFTEEELREYNNEY